MPITLTFATIDDLEEWLNREVARRLALRSAPTTSLSETRLERLEKGYAKVVETNQQLHHRVKLLEEETLTDWNDATEVPAEQKVA